MVAQRARAARFRRRAVIAAAVAYMAVRKCHRRAANARFPVVCEEFVPWGSGARVIGRSENIIRRRMDWEERRDSLTEKQFSLRCKLSKSRFAEVTDGIRPLMKAENVNQAVRSSGSAVSAELQLSVFLRYLASGHHLDIEDMHGISESTFFNVIRDVHAAINYVFDKVVCFDFENGLEDLPKAFFNRSGGTLAMWWALCMESCCPYRSLVS
jgi:hypothetical protein